ncbi:MAG: DNA polymerase/3'-5' exonuclease PolX [Syntrophorhabdaceae bacterium]
MSSTNIIGILEDIGRLLEIKGENSFKCRAYLNAARTLSDNMLDLDQIVVEGRMRELKGIGEAIAARIAEYLTTGKIEYYEKLKAEYPYSLLELSAIPNLGPRKIKLLFESFNIASIGELEYACRENRLVNLTGFGEKSQERILKGIEFVKKHKGEHLFSEVYPQALAIRDRLKAKVPGNRIEICGSIRRRKEIIKDVDILVAGNDKKAPSLAFTTLSGIEEIYLTGDTKTSVRLISGIDADLRVVDPADYPCALIYFTGSKEHNVRLRGIAKKRGLKLNEYGLFHGEATVGVDSEEDVYGYLGLSYIPPEMREDLGEIEAAESGRLPRLVEEEEIRGVFHIHTQFSDGSDSIEIMADAARKLGFTYIGISDHSKSAYYARGLKVDDIRRQWDRIDELNQRWPGFYIFKGIESDILPDGSLDYDEDILKGFDFIVGSIHSNFKLKRDEQMTRLIQAISNPYMTILGHPTGRLLLSREGYDIDMRTIIDEAAKHDTVIELNASPYRLDIDWRHLPYAKSKNVLISINPDAHGTSGLTEVFYGVCIARKGWQEKKDILNTRSVEEVKEILKAKAKRLRMI